jgi:hypothetical protein
LDGLIIKKITIFHPNLRLCCVPKVKMQPPIKFNLDVFLFQELQIGIKMDAIKEDCKSSRPLLDLKYEDWSQIESKISRFSGQQPQLKGEMMSSIVFAGVEIY